MSAPLTIAIDPPLPTTPEVLLALLSDMGIAYKVHHHPAFFTVEEGLEFEKDIEGAHCRNLFLRDKRERMVLVSALNETKIDLKKLAPLIGYDRLSFGSAQRLWDHLGVRPGSVCPYAAINDKQGLVPVVLDKAMFSHTLVNFHPLINTMTIGVSPADLVRFLEKIDHEAHITDLTLCKPD